MGSSDSKEEIKKTCPKDEPTDPDWPINVFVFHPPNSADDDEVSAAIKEITDKIKDTEDTKKTYTKIQADGTKKTFETYTSAKHFSTKHYALLFAPGEYNNCKFEVGYYVQMAGLGKSPNDVRFTGEQSGPFVEALNKDMPVTEHGSIAEDGSGLCLDTFWRAAENFSCEKCQWAVSQAAPLRNIIVEKDLTCGDGAAFSSGGFLANARVGGKMDYAANQQWFTRAVHFTEKPGGGAWSTCFSGCTGKIPEPGQHSFWGNKLTEHVVTIQEKTEVSVEKPFVSMKKTAGGQDYYELIVPLSTREKTKVAGPVANGQYGDVRSFSGVKVCKPVLPLNAEGEYAEHDDTTYNNFTDEDENITKELQVALDQGKDVVLCPGIFFLTKTLTVKHPNQVILGLGLSTLIAPQDGSPCIRVEPNTPGVRIAGITLEASLQKVDDDNYNSNGNVDGVRSLIEVGIPGVDDAGDPNNPVLLADIFTRVGGCNLERQKVETDAMVRIHSGNVVGDNLWLWRADHVRKADNEDANDPNFPYYHQTRIWDTDEQGNKIKVNECYVENALVVNGKDVNMYGLFCEHTIGHQLVWNGDNGTVSFFQCELPYDVDVDFASDGYVGYYVDENVQTHSGRALGVYSNFQVYDVDVTLGLKVPGGPSITIENPFTRFLQNKGSIKNVIKQGKKIYGNKVSENSKHSNAWVNY